MQLLLPTTSTHHQEGLVSPRHLFPRAPQALARDAAGLTAAHLAAEQGHEEFVELLVRWLQPEEQQLQQDGLGLALTLQSPPARFAAPAAPAPEPPRMRSPFAMTVVSAPSLVHRLGECDPSALNSHNVPRYASPLNRLLGYSPLNLAILHFRDSVLQLLLQTLPLDGCNAPEQPEQQPACAAGAVGSAAAPAAAPGGSGARGEEESAAPHLQPHQQHDSFQLPSPRVSFAGPSGSPSATGLEGNAPNGLKGLDHQRDRGVAGAARGSHDGRHAHRGSDLLGDGGDATAAESSSIAQSAGGSWLDLRSDTSYVDSDSAPWAGVVAPRPPLAGGAWPPSPPATGATGATFKTVTTHMTATTTAASEGTPKAGWVVPKRLRGLVHLDGDIISSAAEVEAWIRWGSQPGRVMCAGARPAPPLLGVGEPALVQLGSEHVLLSTVVCPRCFTIPPCSSPQSCHGMQSTCRNWCNPNACMFL